MNDTDITDNDDPIQKRLPRKDDLFRFDLSLIKNPSISGKYSDSEIEKSQLQTVHETHPSVITYSLN